MAVVGARVSVTASATEVADGGASGATFVIVNRGAEIIALGGASVTYAAGFTRLVDETVTVTLGASEKLYAICDTAKSSVVHKVVTHP